MARAPSRSAPLQHVIVTKKGVGRAFTTLSSTSNSSRARFLGKIAMKFVAVLLALAVCAFADEKGMWCVMLYGSCFYSRLRAKPAPCTRCTPTRMAASQLAAATMTMVCFSFCSSTVQHRHPYCNRGRVHCRLQERNAG